MSAIADLLAGDRSYESIGRFLREHTFPIVEGPSCTFVFHGGADAVYLRHFVWGLETALPLRRVPHTDLWWVTLDLPRGSRVEYKFDLHRGGSNSWVRDPLNPLSTRDPFGGNSVCQADGYDTGDWIEHDPEARPGTLEEHVIQDTPFGEPRRVTVYVPARFRPHRRYRLLLVHDGGDYLKFSRFKTVLDNLIHRGEVAPLIVALTHPGDRLVEYPNDPRHTAFLAEVLLPWLEERYPTFGQPSRRGLMGASFGGVASLSTAWRYPGLFGQLLLQSGSFAFTDIGVHSRGRAFDPVVRFMNEFRANPGKPSDRAFVSCGVYESLIYENRSMVPFLQGLGMEVRFVEARDGHNWENWRDRLREGLSWLFPGPLWMYYE